MKTWEERARCLGSDTEMFFAQSAVEERAAKKVCSRCPVAQECLEYALTNDLRFGVWGGLNRNQRSRVATKRAAARAAQGDQAA